MSDLRVTNLKGRNPGEAPTLPDGVVITGITTVSSVIVGTGITLSSSGINVSGVITATSFSGNGSGLIGVSAGIGTTGSVNTSGIITATSFFGSGANLTGVAGTSVFAAGSAAAPSISPTGDSNTGIFFPAADTIAFAEGGAEAMRVDSSGRLLIGTSSSTDAKVVIANGSEQQVSFKIDNTNSSPVGVQIRYGTDVNAAANRFIDCIGNATTRFLVFSSGNVQNTNNSYAGISDLKLKENIIVAGSQWDDIKALEVKKFNFIDDDKTQIGLIAQDVEQICPGLIEQSADTDDEGNETGEFTKSVKYSVLYMKAVKALQEAMERIETLEQRLTDAGIS